MGNTGFSFDLGALWQVAGGQIILLLAGLAMIFIDLWQQDKPWEKRISMMGWLTALIFAATLGHVLEHQWSLREVVFNGVFSSDKFTVFVITIVLLAGFMVSLMSIGYLKNNGIKRGEYFVLLIFAAYGTVALVQSVDLLMAFMSLAVYILAAFLKSSRASQEGALKYFLLGSFGSAFFLFGLVLFYGVTGSVNITHIATAISNGLFDNPVVLVGLAMLLSGLFFKMALVPFHMWTPDVYEGSPSMITGFMATAVKAGAFGIFLKILAVAFTPMLSKSGQPGFYITAHLSVLGAYWKPVIWWLALLTMFFGNLIAVSQQNVKRMLAYSSVAHAGYMALGLLAANDQGRMGVLFYLFAYTIMNLGAFGVLYAIDGQEGRAQTLEDYRGLGYKFPALSFAMSLFLVSMAGLPPTAGFIGKFYLFSAAIKEGYLLLAALGILTSVIGAYYYLRVIYVLYMMEPTREIAPAKVSITTAAVLVGAALGIMYLGVLPEGLANLADAAQRSLALVF